MHPPQITAFKRGKSLVLKVELDEDAFAHHPFLRKLDSGDPSTWHFELNFHRGWPHGEPTSGRKVQFEHAEPDMPAAVKTIRVYLEHGEKIDIHATPKKYPKAATIQDAWRQMKG